MKLPSPHSGFPPPSSARLLYADSAFAHPLGLEILRVLPLALCYCSKLVILNPDYMLESPGVGGGFENS